MMDTVCQIDGVRRAGVGKSTVKTGWHASCSPAPQPGRSSDDHAPPRAGLQPDARADTMKALVFDGPGRLALRTRPKPVLAEPTDAIVRLTTTTLCGTDLHILRGDVPAVARGRVLGHEGVGIVTEVGPAVTRFLAGDRVLVSLITACGRCGACRKGLTSHCERGGWLLGNQLDGTQAEFVRIPLADNGLHLVPDAVDDEAAVMLSCILPTGLECGAQNGRVAPGDVVAIVGVGPVGLAALLAALLYSPGELIAIDLDDHRLETARGLGATAVINSGDGKAAERVMELTHGAGVDVVIEAVGLGTTFDLCQGIVAPGGRIASMGVYARPVELHLERLWGANITLTTGLVDGRTTSRLVRLVASGRLDPRRLVTHRFPLSQIVAAYDTFANAAQNRAVKVVIQVDNPGARPDRAG